MRATWSACPCQSVSHLGKTCRRACRTHPGLPNPHQTCQQTLVYRVYQHLWCFREAMMGFCVSRTNNRNERTIVKTGRWGTSTNPSRTKRRFLYQTSISTINLGLTSTQMQLPCSSSTRKNDRDKSSSSVRSNICIPNGSPTIWSQEPGKVYLDLIF